VPNFGILSLKFSEILLSLKFKKFLMAVWSLPWDKEDQIKVCVALRNYNFTNFSEKDELENIERNLSSWKDLSESEKAFLEKMLSQYGSSIDI
jgi:hypothetical protein